MIRFPGLLRCWLIANFLPALFMLPWPIAASADAELQPAKIDLLKIGTSGKLSPEGGKEDSAIDTLHRFIKSETGFDNEILKQKGWTELAEGLTAGQLHLGVLPGYEFVWARAKNPELTVLSLAVNTHPYRQVFLIVRQDSKATALAGLRGESLALPTLGQGYLRFYAGQLCAKEGKALEEYFGKITTPENYEDTLDDVVDGNVKAAVVERVGWEGYQRRKPGRAKRLKELMQSEKLPPPVVIHKKGALDSASLERFRNGLINAKNKEEGKRLLNLFRLTSFEDPPADFEEVAARTLKAYPAPAPVKK